MIIDKLRPNEVPLIVPLVKEMLVELKGKKALNEPFFVKIWEEAIATGKGVVFFATNGDGYKGVFAGLSFPSMLTGELMAALLFGYVIPQSRGKLGYRMLKAFDSWAIEKGATVLIIGWNHLMPEENVKMYESLGYVPKETMFSKEL